MRQLWETKRLRDWERYMQHKWPHLRKSQYLPACRPYKKDRKVQTTEFEFVTILDSSKQYSTTITTLITHTQRCSKMKLMELLHQLCLHILDIFKIYLKFGLITLAVYFIAEWYIIRYGAELVEDQRDAQVAASDRSASNSTLSQMFRIVLNFLVI